MKSAEDLRREAQAMLAFDLQSQGLEPLPIEAKESQPMEDDGAYKRLISMTFKSSSDGEPHVVTRKTLYDGTVEVHCTCLAQTGRCWAAKEFRRVAGL
jgi:hypothetical protein